MNGTVLTQQVSWRRFAGIAAVVYGVVAVLFFADVLLSNTTVLSAAGLDLTAYYLKMRAFGFGELARGHLPQWNPHSFSGTPFVANVQTAMFYPPNWVYLVLPAVVATNVSIALHFWLAAWLTALWAHARTAMTMPALLAGLAYACSGGYFLHLHPGHLTILCAGVWIPLLLLCMDACLEGRGSLLWVAAGTLAVAMPVLAGHPQIAYYGYIGAGLYGLAHLSLSPRKWETVGWVAATFVLGAMLAAVQLLPSYALGQVSTRGGGLSREAGFAYALPPENLLTAFLPHLFGSAGGRDYLGRWFLWEVSLFVGVVPMALAAYGVTVGTRQRRAWGVVIVLVLFAGVSPAVHAWMQRWVPGYATFRAAGRFGMVIDLLLAVLAADGLAELMRRPAPPRWLVGALAGVAVVMGAAIGVVHAGNVWSSMVEAIGATGQCFLPAETLRDPAVLAVSLRTATVQLAVAAVIFAAMAGVVVVWRRQPARAGVCVAVLVAVGAADLLWAAYADRSKGPAEVAYPEAWARVLPAKGSGQRVITVDPEYANVAMTAGFLDATGYDSTVLSRYARFLAVSQGEDPRTVDAVPGINKRSPLFRAVRVARVLYGSGADAKSADVAGPLPRFAWVHGYEVHAEPTEMYASLGPPTFDPAAVAMLESPPSPEPVPGGADGTVRVLGESPEAVEIEATTPTSAILLMTDAYAPGWRVIGRGPNDHYDLLPADLALRAIPLVAGTHRLRIEYHTPLLAVGAWVSGLTAVGLVGALVVDRRRRARHR